MYLIKIKICNFKSYRGVNVFDNLTTGHNVFIGDNGAGKTTIFQAIEFVLATERKNTNWKTLLPVISSRSTEGFVELQFSNSDPMFDGMITIRKTFSLKDCKETCYINNTKFKSKDFLEYLEIFGLRFYQPFIHNAIIASEFVRHSPEQNLLSILKYLGGSVFENYIFIDNIFYILEAYKEKIEYLRALCKRGEQLSTEGSISSKKKSLNEIKLSIIYNLMRRKKADKILIKDKFEAQYKAILSEEPNKISSIVRGIKTNIMDLKNTRHIQEDILNELKKEEEDLLKKLEKIKNTMNSLQEELKFMNEHSDHTEYLQSIKEQRTAISDKIKDIEVVLKQKREELIQFEARHEIKKGLRVILLSKLQKPMPEENIEYLDKLRNITQEKKQVEEQLAYWMRKSDEYKMSKTELESKINDMKSAHTMKIQEANKKITDLKRHMTTHHESLRESRKNETVLENEILDMSRKIQSLILKLHKKYGLGIITGCESVFRVVEDWRNSQDQLAECYFGLVIENIEYSPGLNLAIETAVGSRLFAHIVSNNYAGTKILEVMKNRNLHGEAWFIPLDIRSQHYQAQNLENAVPLLEKLKFSPRFAKVMEFLFGGVLLCKDIDSACHISRLYGHTCITIQGDRVTNNGVMCGGYFDIKRNALEIYSCLNNLQSQQSIKQEALNKEKMNIASMESYIVKTISNIQELKATLSDNSNLMEIEKLKLALLTVEGDYSAAENNIDRNKSLLIKLDLSKNILDEEMTKVYGNEEEITSKLEDINKEIVHLSKSINEIYFILLHSEQEKNALTNKLNHHFLIENYKGKELATMKLLSDKLNDCHTKLSILNNRVKFVQSEMKKAEQKIKDSSDKLSEKSVELEKILDGEIVLSYFSEEIKDITKQIDYCNSKINVLDNFISDMEEKHNVRSFKSVQKYRNFTTSELYKKLNEIREQLSNLENERSEQDDTDSFSSYSDKFNQIENFFSLTYVFFSQFVEWLHNYIERRLKLVSEKFSILFSEITEGGEGWLFIDDDGSSSNWPALSGITGIKIFVNLPNLNGTWDLSKLSNGQRICVLVALSLASVNATSVPLFIYDEIDKILSNEQRLKLHNVIHSYNGFLQVLSSSHSHSEAPDNANIYCV